MAALAAPTPLTGAHACNSFHSGKASLDDWLQRRALRNQSEGASRTYVVTERGGDAVLAYYALAAGSVEPDAATGAVRRNMPSPVPVVVLARLAVDRRLQGQGIGKALLKDAVLRTVAAADVSGVRAMLIHALDAEAAAFYRRFGFAPAPMDDLTLMLPLKSLKALIDPATP